MRPEITIGDLLHAFAALAPKTDAEKRAIAAMLGFEWRSPSAAEEKRFDVPVNVQGPERRVRRTEPPPPPSPPTPAPDNDARQGSASGVRISPPRPVERPQLDWLATVRPMAPGAIGRAHDPAPLFRPQWTRAILSTSLAAGAPIGSPDIARAVETIARGEALRVLPRQPILTLVAGVQALIDVGEAMQPFWHDRAVLRRDLTRLLGGSLDILECDGTPRETRRDEDSFKWVDYEARFLPRFSASVLIVSDFGIGRSGLARHASPHSWARLARRLARGGHRVVGFVPYPPARWPADLARAIHLVPWDRATRAGRISYARARRGA